MRQVRMASTRGGVIRRRNGHPAGTGYNQLGDSRHDEPMEHMVATIVEYTDKRQPENSYPQRIISSPRSGPCCFADREEIGEPTTEGRWVFRYKRCEHCGFAVRVILREIPNAALAAELREALTRTFARGGLG